VRICRTFETFVGTWPGGPPKLGSNAGRGARTCHFPADPASQSHCVYHNLRHDSQYFLPQPIGSCVPNSHCMSCVTSFFLFSSPTLLCFTLKRACQQPGLPVAVCPRGNDVNMTIVHTFPSVLFCSFCHQTCRMASLLVSKRGGQLNVYLVDGLLVLCGERHRDARVTAVLAHTLFLFVRILNIAGIFTGSAAELLKRYNLHVKQRTAGPGESQHDAAGLLQLLHAHQVACQVSVGLFSSLSLPVLRVTCLQFQHIQVCCSRGEDGSTRN